MTYREWDTAISPAQSIEVKEMTEPDGSQALVVTTMHTSRSGGTTTTRQKVTRGAAWDLVDELIYTLAKREEIDYREMEEIH